MDTAQQYNQAIDKLNQIVDKIDSMSDQNDDNNSDIIILENDLSKPMSKKEMDFHMMYANLCM